jgi:RNA polymerase sigma factor (sigma-70 family)
MDTLSNKSLISSGVAHSKLWYVPDRRIRTQSATRRATGIAQWVTTRQGSDMEPDEHALFTALHTCAFRAARCAGGENGAVVERKSWFSRWRGIREYIVERNLGLAYAMIRRFNSPGEDEDDRLSDAMLGLTRAVDRFNPWRGYRFSTYACNAIGRALIRRGRRETRYRQLFPVQYDVLFERPVGPSDSSAELYAERLSRAIGGNLADLTKREAKIIALRFQRKDGRRSTFQEIGDAVGMSKERVRQIQNGALSKLREVLEADPVLQ